MTPNDSPPRSTAIAAALAAGAPADGQALSRARAFAEPLLAASLLDTGENTLAHADAMVGILAMMGGPVDTREAPTGVNDVAVLGGTVAGDVTEDQVLTASGLLTVTDADAG